MNILLCNVGSTSLKYRLYDMNNDERTLFSGIAERVGTARAAFSAKNETTGETMESTAMLPTHKEAILAMLNELRAGGDPKIDCVGFKVVHAKGVTGVQFLTDEVLAAMAAFNTVAPAHNPPYLAAIRLFRDLMPGVPLIGAFETAFHKDMPPEASLYPIPIHFARDEKIRRYGFHGASHEFLSGFAAERMGRRNFNLISCHLGGSGSLCAVKNGVSIDTSLGFSLQCGVMHNNRSGDFDPYIIFYLVEQCGMTLPEVRQMLETESGFLGMSGVSSDLRDVELAAKDGNRDAENAICSYCYSIKKYIGAYTAALGGLDALVFGGGIGRNSFAVRSRALSGLECLGIRLDEEKNCRAISGDEISHTDSSVRVFVVDTNEELIVARKAMSLMQAQK